MTVPLHPLAGMALVAVILGGMLLALRSLRGKAHPEVVRKLLHVGMGLVTLSFPWIFPTSWPVAALAVGASVLLLLLRRDGLRLPGTDVLRGQLGGVVDGVERRSWGEIYFPLAVALLFYLSRGDSIAYCIPVLLLTLSDAVAALIGVRYGVLRYTTDDGQKTWEGSIAFFVVSFLAVHIPLLLFTTTGRAECLFIGLILGLLMMLLEAAAWGGLDNLLIPLGGYMLLQTFRDLEVMALGIRLAVVLALVAFALFWRPRTTLNHGAVLGAAVIGFIAWAVGGWRWLLPPVTLFALYSVLFPRANPDGSTPSHSARTVFYVTGIGMFWLFVASVGKRPDYLIPYAVSFGAHLAIIGALRLGARFRDRSGWPALLLSIGLGGAAVLLPIAVSELLAPLPLLPQPTLWLALLLALPGILIAVTGERCISREGEPEEGTSRNNYLRQATVLIGTLLPLLAPALNGGTPS